MTFKSSTVYGKENEITSEAIGGRKDCKLWQMI